jgi:hypothetical protein
MLYLIFPQFPNPFQAVAESRGVTLDEHDFSDRIVGTKDEEEKASPTLRQTMLENNITNQ